jgi:DNA-binding NtrC family response regulator/serine/threonine protein kinase/tetratricopeptide (TPR) repeat protein
MRRLISNRFNVIKVLRDGRGTSTLLASDLWAEKRTVLIKTLNKNQFNSERIAAEKTLSIFMGVRHPQIIPIWDVGASKSEDFYVIREYVSEEPNRVIKQNVKHVRSFVRAAMFLHTMGYVHGAIKPPNIFISNDTVRLSDPKLYQSMLKSTQEVRFTAPEVLSGKRPSPESDLYSVGALLHRWIVGEDPFEDSDANLLKLKCMWASPHTTTDNFDLVRNLWEPVRGLMNKNPRKRVSAFQTLVHTLEETRMAALQSPFVGRTSVFNELRNELLDDSKEALRAIVIEGAPGIGKSRLIEELRITCAVAPIDLVICECKDDSLLPRIAMVLDRLLHSRDEYRSLRTSNIESLLNRLRKYNDTPSSTDYPFQRTVSDLVGVFRAMAGCLRIAVVIEDVHLANPAVFELLEQLCFRAAELPFLLIVTCLEFAQVQRLEALLKGMLTGDLHYIKLKGLDRRDSQTLSKALASSNVDQAMAVDISGGNPLFLREYSIGTTNSPVIREVVACTLSNLNDDDRQICETLSLFTDRIEPKILMRICNRDDKRIEGALAHLEASGAIVITEDRVHLHQAVREAISTLIPSRRRVDLNRKAFTLVHSVGCSEDLARLALGGKLFDEASKLYRTLGNLNFKDQNYKLAASCYELALKCSRQGSEELNVAEKLMLARCYGHLGRIRDARRLFKALLSSELVHSDAELLSSLYVSFGNICSKTKPSTRIALSELAVKSLPLDSPNVSLRYIQHSVKLLHVGDLGGAKAALQQAELHGIGAARALFVAAKGSLLIQTGDFRAAVDCFSYRMDSNTDKLAVINNLGLCFEHLGKLSKARRCFEQSERLSLRTGHIGIRVLSVSNTACIATKLGDMVAARQLYSKAMTCISNLRATRQEFDEHRFKTAYADIAVYSMHTGDFGRAIDSVQWIQLSKGWVDAFDGIFCSLVKAECFGRLGEKRLVDSILNSSDKHSLSSTPFCKVAKALVEARIGRYSPEKTLSTLSQSLTFTENGGTLYQQSEVLNELSRVSFDMNDKVAAAQFAKRSLNLARRNRYRLLSARAMLFLGRATDIQAQKQRCLYGAFQEASEMGLRELVSECAYEIGVFQLAQKNWVTAQEYLVRSISVVEEIAEGVPELYRANYINLSTHRKALHALKACNPEVQKLFRGKSNGLEFGNEKRYFAGLYQLTTAASTASSIEMVATAIAKALAETLSRPAVVTVKSVHGTINKIVKAKHDEELIRQAERFIGKTRDRIYFATAEAAPHKPIAWIRFESATCEGGVYLACGPHEPTFTEREIEFLTIIGTIGSSALAGIENRRRDETPKTLSEFQGMIGTSKAINEIFSQIQLAASNSATVLIEGESGTGKELVAKAIHAEGARAKEPFIAVDCGAIPESLIEAELFGAKKGSYTGAVSDRPGLFEAAHRGTIFLDEISNTTPALQAKLLRVIQEREVRRIGEMKNRAVDVRLIVASNQKLEVLAADGVFRKDLLYRLKVLHIKVPPLRNRRDDIPMLAHAFLQKLNSVNKTRKYLAPEAMDRLITYNFPGNVRELQNAMERAFFSARGTTIHDVQLETEATHDASAAEDVQSWFKDLSEGRKDFWSAVHNKYKRRDISREKVMALVDFGLRSTRGNYKTMASKLKLKGKDYRRFMDFLRRSECLLDFRPYRKLAATSES